MGVCTYSLFLDVLYKPNKISVIKINHIVPMRVNIQSGKGTSGLTFSEMEEGEQNAILRTGTWGEDWRRFLKQ